MKKSKTSSIISPSSQELGLHNISLDKMELINKSILKFNRKKEIHTPFQFREATKMPQVLSFHFHLSSEVEDTHINFNGLDLTEHLDRLRLCSKSWADL